MEGSAGKDFKERIGKLDCEGEAASMRMIVIGGGPAGMAAAVSAKKQGVEEVLLLERHPYLGGVLPQCIHNGFGTQLYGEDYAGGEYAWMWKEKTVEAGVRVTVSYTHLPEIMV